MSRAVVLIPLAAIFISVLAIGWLRNSRINVIEVSQEARFAFATWKKVYGRQYKSPQEDGYRMMSFYKNFLMVKNHNEPTYEVALNKFADLTQEEFRAKYLSAPQKAPENNLPGVLPRDPKLDAIKDIPATWDWRSKGAVQSVKDQGECKSSYAFAAVSAFESASFINGYSLYDMSEQQILDCSGAVGTLGCNGGYPQQGLNYIYTSNGLQSETTYPYTGVKGKCSVTNSSILPPKTNGYYFTLQNNCTDLQIAIVREPVAVDIDALSITFYKSGVFSTTKCGTTREHAVSVVGYGTDSQSGKNYWIVKNSWGVSWGEQGYIRMDRDVQQPVGICGICVIAYYPHIY